MSNGNNRRLKDSFRLARPTADTTEPRPGRRLRFRALRRPCANGCIRLSTKRGRRLLRALPDSRHASPKFVRRRSVLRGFRPLVFPHGLSAASRVSQRRAVLDGFRGTAVKVQRSAYACRFSGFVFTVPCFRAVSNRRRILRVRPACRQGSTNPARMRGDSRRNNRRKRPAIKHRSKRIAVSLRRFLDGLQLEGRDAFFKNGDSVGRFFAEHVCPITKNRQRTGGKDIPADRKRGGEHHSQLFGVHSDSCFDPRLVTRFAKGDIAGRTGDSRKSFPNCRRAGQFNQVSEFETPGNRSAQKKKAAFASLLPRLTGRIHATRPA
jgi:hypothetical protein